MELVDFELKSSGDAWALITGASSGIGREIAIRLAKLGFRLLVNHFHDPQGALETLRQAGVSESRGHALGADVGSPSEVEAMFGEIRKLEQPLSVLVNNAAVQTFASILDLKPDDWLRTIQTNLTGSFLCVQQAARLMQTGGGTIINIGSGANRVPFPKLVDYCSSKGGIEMLTKVAAIELGKFAIRVNCVAPGAIENERTQRESPGYAETWGSITPLGRCGKMVDVADAVELLVSDKARFITGQTLYVDGGLWTRGQWPYES